MRFVFALTLALLAASVGSPTHAAEPTLSTPRFAALRSDEVNVRTGPGVRYPIDWVFTRKTLPVQITAEVDTFAVEFLNIADRHFLGKK